MSTTADNRQPPQAATRKRVAIERATRDPSTTSLGLHLDEDDAQYQVCGLASEALALRINPHAIACGYF
jgi:hypothetical protein